MQRGLKFFFLIPIFTMYFSDITCKRRKINDYCMAIHLVMQVQKREIADDIWFTSYCFDDKTDNIEIARYNWESMQSLISCEFESVSYKHTFNLSEQR
jgi:hypothetical protein